MEQLTQRPVPSVSATGPSTYDRYLAAHSGMEGWFDVRAAAAWDCLLYLQQAKGIGGHVLEIGVWHGKSASMLGMHSALDQELMILVDQCVGPKALEAALAKVGVPWSESIHHLQMPAEQLTTLPLMTDGFQSFRFIHLDGEHTFGAVTRDLATADRLLDKGGIVCVGDFFNWLYPQVTEGVLRYVREHPEQYSLFLCGFNKAFLARPEFVHEYLEHCGGPLVEELEARGVKATLAKTSYPADMNCFGMGPRVDGYDLRGPDQEKSKIRI